MTMLRCFALVFIGLSIEAVFAQAPDSSYRIPEMTVRFAVPTDPATGELFDPRNAAWEYPQGTYLRLGETLAQSLKDGSVLQMQSPRLAEFIHDWRGRVADLAIVIADNNPPNVGIRSAAEIRLCGQREDCAHFLLARRDAGMFLEFLGSFDVAKNRFPQPQTKVPSPHWRWDRTGRDGQQFVNYLVNRDVVVEGGNQASRDQCHRSKLDCSQWRDGALVGCQFVCEPAR